MIFGVLLTVLIILLVVAILIAIIGYGMWLASPRKKTGDVPKQETSVTPSDAVPGKTEVSSESSPGEMPKP